MNRTKPINTNANDDSSRAGQWANGQAWIGLSNKTFGDVTFGRQNALNSDVIGNYDPVKSNAFSPIGFSSSYAGWGNTEIARVNTAIEYNGKVAIDQLAAVVRFAGQAQVGNGYYLGNGAMADYSGQIGVDWKGFSFDVVGGFAKDAVALSSLYNSLPTNLKPGLTYNWNNVLPATLSNDLGWTFAGKYKWDAFTVYAGYSFLRQMSPSDQYSQGFDTISPGIYVPGNVPGSLTTDGKGYSWISTTKYLTNRVLNTYWIGGKWDTPFKDLAFNTGVYYSTQPNYNTSWASCNGKNNTYNSSSCAGSQLSYAFLLTYKVLKRVDVYAGVMVSSVYGGLASGYFTQQSVNPTAGLRFNF
jgi:predicted porin